MINTATTLRLVSNARRLNKPAQALSLALELVTKQPWTNLCVWCAEHVEGEAHYISGDCARCSYSGVDTMVVQGA
jgi:hypothetical protein